MKDAKDILVSVVIPTYSRNDTLERAINCALAQTHQKIEVIVVDDNPADSEYRKMAAAIIEKYAQDARVRYIQNPQNLGGSGARNVGIEASEGEYIAFLDDDDEYYPTKIEKQLQVFLNSTSDKLAMVYCDVEHAGKNGNVDCVIKAKHRGNCLYEAIVDDCIANTSEWLVKKSLLNNVGNFTIVPCKQDSTVIIKLLRAGYEVDFVPEVLCRYNNFTGVVRISFGPKKLEGEKMFCDLCRESYYLFTPKQIRNIEFSNSKRMYLLLKSRKALSDVLKVEKQKMWKYGPVKAACFFVKQELRKIKKKIVK